MCGIVGIVAKSPVNQTVFDALTVLQHRGQDAAGIVTSDQGHFYLRKDNGLVRDVFRTRHMKRLQGNLGIGHIRYPTAGSASSAEAQPMYVNSPFGISLAHNGNLTNADDLRAGVLKADLRHMNTSSDSEVLLNVFAHALQRLNKRRLTADDIFAAVNEVHQRVKGGYAVVALISGYGLVAFRDPHGIRPIVFGSRDNAEGEREYMVASESVALDASDFRLERDIAPGETVFIAEDGHFYHSSPAVAKAPTPCIFEYVYFARPDSIIDDVSVYKARLRMGVRLAKKILDEKPNHDIDVVIPIPDTSRTTALEVAHALGVKYREGFIKNRYIGRTFIMPGQVQRKKSVKQKLNAIDLEFRGKNVLLVDDSIVRGTTCEQIVEMAREAGAKNVYFASAAPEVRFPNVYGIDMPAKTELIAHDRDLQTIRKAIGADWLIYQNLDDLVEAVQEGNPNLQGFDCSVFDGCYVTGDIDEPYLDKLQQLRAGVTNALNDEDSAVLEIHNEPKGIA